MQTWLAGSFFNRHVIRLNALWLIVGIQFQSLFTPLPGFFSPFPHGTGSLSVTREYLALCDGPHIFRQDIWPDVLWIPLGCLVLSLQGYHLLWLAFPGHSDGSDNSTLRSEHHSRWFGLFRFRSPLLTESIIIFLFLWVLRCFNSPGVSSNDEIAR